MEWKWHTADRTNGEFDENIAILRALLEALQSVSKPASSNLSLEEIAQKSMEDFHAKREKNVTPEALESKEPAKVNLAPKTTDLNSFMAKLEESAKETAATKSKTESTPAESSDSVFAAAAAANQTEEQTSTDSSATTGPLYPKSFTEVMEMLKKGEEIPGIQEIEEKVSVDSAKFLDAPSATSNAVQEDVVGAAAAAPKKPWEQLSG